MPGNEQRDLVLAALRELIEETDEESGVRRTSGSGASGNADAEDHASDWRDSEDSREA